MVCPSSRSNHRRQSHSPVEGPLWHFFKIILPSNLRDQKMRLPKKFVRKFRDELSDVARVDVPSGHAWRIGLKKAKSDIWLDHGWQKFVKHHCIDGRYLVVFKYKGLSNFSVLIFGMNGYEIQYPSSTSGPSGEETNHGLNFSFDHENCILDLESPISSPDCGVYDQALAVEQSNRRCNASAEMNVGTRKFVAGQENYNFERLVYKRSKRNIKEDHQIKDSDDAHESRIRILNRLQTPTRHGSLFNNTKVDKGKHVTECGESELLSTCEEQMEIVVYGLAKASEASKRALHAARMFKPKHPSFMVLLRPYNISHNFVHVPLRFAGKFLNEAADRIKLQVSDGREWTLRVIRCKQHSVKLSKGWHNFHKENDLKEGDVCVFELIKSKKHALKVTMFRAV